jgi:hypothetical protein
MMHQALAVQAFAGAQLAQQVDRVLLEHCRAHTLLDVVAVASLEDDRFDAVALQAQREGEAGRPGADDGDLRLHQGVQ